MLREVGAKRIGKHAGAFLAMPWSAMKVALPSEGAFHAFSV